MAKAKRLLWLCLHLGIWSAKLYSIVVFPSIIAKKVINKYFKNELLNYDNMNDSSIFDLGYLKKGKKKLEQAWRKESFCPDDLSYISLKNATLLSSKDGIMVN